VLTPKLLRAFRATRYEADGIGLRIGHQSPAMAAKLTRRGVRQAALVTAWNPFSHAMPRGWNDRMQDRLRQAARGRVIGEGWGRGRGWAEHHLLVAGDPRRVLVLARRFRQLAIVVVERRRPPRLLPA
jgi:hypothetical protein